MKKIKVVLLLVFMITCGSSAFADSPITSTPFYQAYYDGGIVTYAAGKKTVDNTIADYLANDNNPIDVRMAVINAMGWDIAGRNNTELYLTQVYEGKENFEMKDLSAEQKLVIGYMTIMDDYFKPAAGLPYLEEALKEMDNSLMANIIYALAKGQEIMDKDFCEVWRYYEKAINKQYPGRDFSYAGEMIVSGYINGYKEYCK